MKNNPIFVFFMFSLFVSATLSLPLSEQVESTTKAQNIYVLSALEHHEEVPLNAFEIKPDEAHKDIPDDHILKKKIIALPLSDVKNDTKVLTNGQGHAIIAHGTDDSNEEMMTAESIVFRPLFSYRRQQAQRRRIYVPERSYNYNQGQGQTRGSTQTRNVNNNEYVPSCNRRKQYSSGGDNGNDNSLEGSSRPRRRYPSYYPDYYHNAQFPALI